MIMPELIVLLIGLASAVKGADWLGRASISVAQKYGISQIVIGATLVTIATTLPELTISTIAGNFSRNSSIALGTVLGSPLTNLGIILALYFIFSGKRPSIGYFSRAVNFFILLAILLLAVSTNTSFGGALSLFLILLGMGFLGLEFIISKRSESVVDAAEAKIERVISLFDFAKNKREAFEVFFGSILLVLGSKFVVDSALSLATIFKIDELFLAITVVAIGTSLPEFFTAVNSFIFKRDGITMGNLIGASIINLTLGIGLGTIFQSASLSYPKNFLILIPLIIIGFLSLISVWKKIPVKALGLVMIAVALVSLLIFSLYEIR